MKKEYTPEELEEKCKRKEKSDARKEFKEFIENFTNTHAGEFLPTFSKEEAEKAYTLMDKFKTKHDGCVRSNWQYLMGTIGSLNFEYCGNTEKSKNKPFEKHPKWRPFGHYYFTVPNWNHSKYLKIEGYIQSWEECKYISSTEGFLITIYKHPLQ